MKRIGFIAIGLVVLGAAIGCAHAGAEPLPTGTHADRVLVRKSARKLELYRGDELLRSYHVSLGKHPRGHKQQEGDGRTPEGHYVIDYRKPDSAFHRALHISYPSPADVAAAKARNVSPGGLIMVHGLRNDLGFLGRLHRLKDWTNGCIAVTNDEIDEIARVVTDGTPIDIVP